MDNVCPSHGRDGLFALHNGLDERHHSLESGITHFGFVGDRLCGNVGRRGCLSVSGVFPCGLNYSDIVQFLHNGIDCRLDIIQVAAGIVFSHNACESFT